MPAVFWLTTGGNIYVESGGFGDSRFVIALGRVGKHLDRIESPLNAVFVKNLVVFHADLRAVVGAKLVEGGVDAHLEHVGAVRTSQIIGFTKVNSESAERLFRDESQLNARGKGRIQGRGRQDCLAFGGQRVSVIGQRPFHDGVKRLNPAGALAVAEVLLAVDENAAGRSVVAPCDVAPGQFYHVGSPAKSAESQKSDGDTCFGVSTPSDDSDAILDRNVPPAGWVDGGSSFQASGWRNNKNARFHREFEELLDGSDTADAGRGRIRDTVVERLRPKPNVKLLQLGGGDGRNVAGLGKVTREVGTHLGVLSRGNRRVIFLAFEKRVDEVSQCPAAFRRVAKPPLGELFADVRVELLKPDFQFLGNHSHFVSGDQIVEFGAQALGDALVGETGREPRRAMRAAARLKMARVALLTLVF